MSLSRKRKREIIVACIEGLIGFLIVVAVILAATVLLKWAGVL